MQIAIIGGGPAGLRAAEVAAAGGAAVSLFEAKPSVGRKFLVAGRGGLNISQEEPPDSFAAHYTGGEDWASTLAQFALPALREWAAGLGSELFTASTGRVYPRELKAAPLLRRWVERLRAMGVRFHTRHRWCGAWERDPRRLEFEIEGGTRTSFLADAAILALGGGSWPETGSDGQWVAALQALGVPVAPLQPANCGWECAWTPATLAAAEGHPLKNLAVRAGDSQSKGELLVTRYGLEGGALYQLAPALRGQAGPLLEIDFKPELSHERLLAKMGPIRRHLLAEARTRWKLSEPAGAVLAQFAPPENDLTPEALVRLVKACPIPLRGPRPLAEAISSGGGVAYSGLTEDLMLRACPGLFVAGEMVDWEAPTGGYLIHGSMAQGTVAARGALRWLFSQGR